MPDDHFMISLPIADRVTSAQFYRRLLVREPFGAPSEDGVPEPLQFAIGEHTTLMLVPNVGFGWVVGADRQVAAPPATECVLTVALPDRAAVDERTDVARRSGATVLGAPEVKPWGYAALVADPDGHLWQLHAPA